MSTFKPLRRNVFCRRHTNCIDCLEQTCLWIGGDFFPCRRDWYGVDGAIVEYPVPITAEECPKSFISVNTTAMPGMENPVNGTITMGTEDMGNGPIQSGHLLLFIAVLIGTLLLVGILATVLKKIVRPKSTYNRMRKPSGRLLSDDI